MYKLQTGDRHVQLAKVVGVRQTEEDEIKLEGYFTRAKLGLDISGMQNVHEVLLTCFFAVPICVLFTCST